LRDELAARLAAVREEVGAAARRAGRNAATVGIVAVTKTLPPAAVRAALAAGLQDIGENYVQEARAKRDAVGGGGTWHLIGNLQRNKVRAAVATFDHLATVDSVAVARALAAEASRGGRRLAVSIQVNVTADRRKRGLPPEDTAALAEAILGLAELDLRGLMTIGPLGSPEDSRPCFRGLRALRDDVGRRLGVELPHLCMGMSGDFPVAVEEGATLLRLGRALFGDRSPGSWRPGPSAGGEGS
jgi:pyridoxal phosphate enzyme (YggS family)